MRAETLKLSKMLLSEKDTKFKYAYLAVILNCLVMLSSTFLTYKQILSYLAQKPPKLADERF